MLRILKTIIKIGLVFFVPFVTSCSSLDESGEKPVIQESELSETEQEYYDLIVKYWKGTSGYNHYSECSTIPTADSTVFGVKYVDKKDGIYIYSYQNPDESVDITKAYILAILHDNDQNELDTFSDFPVIKVNGKIVAVIGTGSDDKYGSIMAVSPVK